MRNLLLATSAVFLLSGGFAFAGYGGGGGGGGYGGGGSTKTTTTTTLTSIPVTGNAASLGFGNSAAAGGGAATTTDGNNSNNSWESVSKTLTDVGNSSLSVTKTDTHINVTLATSSNSGSVTGSLTVNGSKTEDCGCTPTTASYNTGSNTMDNSANGTGIMSAAQNTGTFSLQQNSVALGSVITGGSGSVF